MLDERRQLEHVGSDDLRVRESADGAITVATIDRPEVRNAMNPGVERGLHSALDHVETSATRVLVIRGADGTFCSGGDLGEMGEATDTLSFRENFSILSNLATRFVDLDALVVAAVEGYCLAGGLGLAAACDFTVASDDSTFGTPEMNVGLFPMQAMAPILRSSHGTKALHMLFTGEFVDAATAEEMGLVTAVVPAEEFDERAGEFVATLASKSPTAIAMGKRAYHTHREMSYDDALEYLRDCFAVLATSSQAREGLVAFDEDREPEWSR